MTNEELIQKIKAEIERLKEENRKIKCQANERYCSGYDDAFYDLVPFLDTLEEEPVSDDLKEAADNYIHEVTDAAGHPGWEWITQDIKDAFIAGAKWQKQEMLKDNPVIMSVEDFQALIDSHAKRVEADYKEKMLKDAVDMTLCNLSLGNHMEKVLVPGNRFPNGKTIRVIIVKEDKK